MNADEAQAAGEAAQNAHEDYNFAILEEMVKITDMHPDMDGDVARARAAVAVRVREPELYQKARDGIAFMQGRATAAHVAIANTDRANEEFRKSLEKRAAKQLEEKKDE